MKDIILYIFHEKLGIDKAIAYTISTRGVQLLSAVFTVYFTTRFFTPEEQGFYFTFASILALQVFFELGFTGVITQFVAHEASHLTWTDNYELIGEEKYKSRLASLIHFCAKWYSRLAIFLLFALVIAGIFFFKKYNTDKYDITWKLPWVLLVIGTCLNFMIAPFSSFLEGIGKVKEIAKVRFIQQIISPLIYCGGLALGTKLFVSSFMVFTSTFVFIFMIYKLSLYKYLITIWKQEIAEKIKYFNEIFPYQWKIALSWVSGYFIFQLFNPVLFASEGAVVAGQMGITLTALNSLMALSYSWINTKTPTLSGFIARKDYKSLDILFFKTMKQIVFVSITITSSFVFAIFVLQYYDITILGSNIGKRFLPLLPLSIFSFALLLQVPTYTWAVYLRCHKKEPLLINSIVGGLLSCLSALLLGKHFGLYGIIIGFLIVQFTTGFIWVYIIFTKKRKEWHE